MGADYARHITVRPSPLPRIQNAIYTSFHPIQTMGADYARQAMLLAL